MSARELAAYYPTVSTHDGAVDAAPLPAEHKLPAPLVVDPDGRPCAIVPGSRLVPEYAREDPLLTAVIDDRDLDEVPEKVTGLTVAMGVGPDASVIRIASVTARTHTPLVAVVEHDDDRTRLAGAVTAARPMQPLTGGS
ncbi:hypothetical protein [Streptomyces canus]|uniref:hypothetical protein n=1 Tax=Streptomyces canus TaxID=58343 RepID=UPI00225844A0|nr:hypothetical protein [Streptomyces canus]MCX4855060.1 hypothetical protein [Streptomyces canus]